MHAPAVQVHVAEHGYTRHIACLWFRVYGLGYLSF